MKKFIIFGLIIVIVFGTVIGITIFLKVERQGVEEVLPQEPQLYVHFDNVSQNLNDIASSQIWKSLKEINYNLLLEKSNFSREQVDALKTAFKQITDPQTQAFLQKFFGQEVALAIYPMPIDLSSMASLSPAVISNFVNDVFSNIFIVTRIPADIQILELFSGMIGNLGEGVSQETVHYKDFKIHVMSLKDIQVKIAFVRIKDLLVISFGERAAQKSVDVYRKDRTALSSDPNFQETRKKSVDSSEISGYWDMEKFFSAMKSQIDVMVSWASARSHEDDSGSVAEQFEQAFKTVAGFKTVSLSMKTDKLTEIKTRVTLDKSQLDPQFASFYNCPASQNKTIELIPSGVLGYYWSDCIVLGEYWKQVKTEFDQMKNDPGQDPQEKIDWVESSLGLGIENDILPAFGTQFGGYLSDIEIGGIFPLPKFLLFAKIADKSKAEVLFSKLTQNSFFMLQTENYDGIPIQYINSPLGGNQIQPGYCFLDDYVLIAINRSLLESSIDAYKKRVPSLLQDQVFQRIDQGLSDENTGIYFSRVGQFAEKLEDIIKWINSWAKAQYERKDAFREGSLKRLEDVKVEIKGAQQELEQIQENIKKLDTEMAGLTSQGMDTSAVKTGLENARKLLTTKKNDIEALEDKQVELRQLVAGYDGSTKGEEMKQLLLDEVAYPVLRSLSSVESLGVRTTTQGDTFESTVLIKVWKSPNEHP